MTNREKLIELLTEKDGKVQAEELFDLISTCSFYSDEDDCFGCLKDCNICVAKWLNEEAV